jgi:hypothetical protein
VAEFPSVATNFWAYVLLERWAGFSNIDRERSADQADCRNTKQSTKWVGTVLTSDLRGNNIIMTPVTFLNKVCIIAIHMDHLCDAMRAGNRHDDVQDIRGAYTRPLRQKMTPVNRLPLFVRHAYQQYLVHRNAIQQIVSDDCAAQATPSGQTQHD